MHGIAVIDGRAGHVEDYKFKRHGISHGTPFSQNMTASPIFNAPYRFCQTGSRIMHGLHTIFTHSGITCALVLPTWLESSDPGTTQIPTDRLAGIGRSSGLQYLRHAHRVLDLFL